MVDEAKGDDFGGIQTHTRKTAALIQRLRLLGYKVR